MVENDAYGELRYEGEPVAAIKQLDDRGGTVLLRSFSKVSFPGFARGMGAGAEGADRPHAACEGSRPICIPTSFRRRCCWSSRNRAGWARTARACWRRARSGCARRSMLAASILPAGTRWTRPQGGMNVWVRLARAAGCGAAFAARAEGRRGVSAGPVFRGVAAGCGRVAVEFRGLAAGARSGEAWRCWVESSQLKWRRRRRASSRRRRWFEGLNIHRRDAETQRETR